jgi:hypothetical protein
LSPWPPAIEEALQNDFKTFLTEYAKVEKTMARSLLRTVI